MEILLTIDEAAAIMRKSPHTIRRWTEKRKIASVKLGSAVRIKQSVLESYIREHERPAVPEIVTDTLTEPSVAIREAIHATR